MKHNWEYKKLGDVASFNRGLTFANAAVVDSSSKRVLRSNNINLTTHSLNFDNVVCLKEGFAIPENKKLHKGDIFICMSNGSTQHLGKVAFVEDDMDYAFGGFMGAIHPEVKKIYPKYAFYACLSSEYRRFLASIFNGVGINNLRWSDLCKFLIPFPPLPVQEQIVSELDKVSEIIAKKKQQLEELDKLAQSVFYDMFGDPVENEKGWEVKPLNEVCDVRDGTHNSPKYIDGGDYILITSKNIVNGKIDYSNINYISKKDYDAINMRSQVDDGDIIMAMIGTIGKPIIVKEQEYKFCIKNVALIKFYKESVVSNVYIQSLLNSTSFSKHIMSKTRGKTQKFIALGTIRKLGIPVPPLDVQQSFDKTIETIEKQKALIKRSIAEIQKFFDYTMDKYFG